MEESVFLWLRFPGRIPFSVAAKVLLQDWRKVLILLIKKKKNKTRKPTPLAAGD